MSPLKSRSLFVNALTVSRVPFIVAFMVFAVLAALRGGSLALEICAGACMFVSGFTDMLGFLPVIVRTSSWTAGMRVEPPTRMTSLTSEIWMPASRRAMVTGALQRSSRSRVMRSNSARVRV